MGRDYRCIFQVLVIKWDAHYDAGRDLFDLCSEPGKRCQGLEQDLSFQDKDQGIFRCIIQVSVEPDIDFLLPVQYPGRDQ